MLHRVVRFSQLEEVSENNIKKYIGYVRVIPSSRGASLEDTDFLLGSNIHYMMSTKTTLYSPGDKSCSKGCPFHGVCVSSDCERDPRYTTIADVDVSKWDDIIKFYKDSLSNDSNNDSATKSEERELCLCFKIPMKEVTIYDEYYLTKIDDLRFTLRRPDPANLEECFQIGYKHDCFIMPLLGEQYNWKPCCLKWREVLPRAEPPKITNDVKLEYVFDALDDLALQDNEAVNVLKMIREKDYNQLFNLEPDIKNFIVSAVEEYSRFNEFSHNYGDDVYKDFYLKRKEKWDMLKKIITEREPFFNSKTRTLLDFYLTTSNSEDFDEKLLDLILNLIEDCLKDKEKKEKKEEKEEKIRCGSPH